MRITFVITALGMGGAEGCALTPGAPSLMSVADGGRIPRFRGLRAALPAGNGKTILPGRKRFGVARPIVASGPGRALELRQGLHALRAAPAKGRGARSRAPRGPAGCSPARRAPAPAKPGGPVRAETAEDRSRALARDRRCCGRASNGPQLA